MNRLIFCLSIIFEKDKIILYEDYSQVYCYLEKELFFKFIFNVVR